jgi:hypothetical protein
MNRRRFSTLLATFAVLAGVVGGVFHAGSETQARSRTWAGSAVVQVYVGDLPTVNGRTWG